MADVSVQAIAVEPVSHLCVQISKLNLGRDRISWGLSPTSNDIHRAGCIKCGREVCNNLWGERDLGRERLQLA